MKRLHIAVLGLGRLGLACVKAALASDDITLSGVVRRADRAPNPLSEHLGAPAYTHWTEIPRFDVALLCLPPELIVTTAHELLQSRKPIVECAELEADDLQSHWARIHQIAKRQHAPAIVGAGWEPGALSMFREIVQLLTPKGHTEISNRPGVSLHHSAWVRDLKGVKDALCTELRSGAGKMQRYVYVELERNADAGAVSDLIRGNPLFFDTETLVLPVESVAELEDEGHGIVMERRGKAAGTGHQLFLLEARFNRWALAGEMMAAAAHAVQGLRPGAHTLLDIPIAAMLGMKHAAAQATAD